MIDHLFTSRHAIGRNVEEDAGARLFDCVSQSCTISDVSLHVSARIYYNSNVCRKMARLCKRKSDLDVGNSGISWPLRLLKVQIKRCDRVATSG